MDFKGKIDKILSIKGIKLYKLAEISGLGNTLEKAYQDNREMKKGTTDRFIQNLGIIPESWDADSGPDFIAGSDEKPTHSEKAAAVAEKTVGDNPLNMIRSLLELEKVGNYMFMPKSVLEGDYRLSLKSERDQTIAALNKLIANLEGEVADKAQEIGELKSRIAALTATEKAK